MNAAVAEKTSTQTSKSERGPTYQWPVWHASLSNYREADNGKALWQLFITVLPYSGLWLLMVVSIRRDYPYGVTLALAAVAAAFLVRVFILFHDCVHGSLFPRKGANTFFGTILGLLAFTPFEDWRFSHLRHHATYANLDARGFGDIWTMTRSEYVASSPAKRLAYRLFRHPAVMFGLGALFSFLLRFRLPGGKTSRKERMSVLFTNLLILGIFIVASRTIGLRTYFLIQLPVMWVAGAAGIWLFFVQHQFDGVYWARKGDWDSLRAAMEGSSFYQLPALLRWFSGNIGYHHIHHLAARIPSYRLKECYDAIPELQAKPPLTLRRSLASVRLKVWDEAHGKLVGFNQAELG